MTVTVAAFTELGWPGLAAGPGDSESCLGLGLRFVTVSRVMSPVLQPQRQ